MVEVFDLDDGLLTANDACVGCYRTSLGAVHVYVVVVTDHKPRLELVGRFEPPPTDPFLRTRITCVKLSPCATYVAVGTRNGTVTIYSVQYGRGIAFSVELQHNEHRVKCARIATAVRCGNTGPAAAHHPVSCECFAGKASGCACMDLDIRPTVLGV